MENKKSLINFGNEFPTVAGVLPPQHAPAAEGEDPGYMDQELPGEGGDGGAEVRPWTMYIVVLITIPLVFEHIVTNIL